MTARPTGGAPASASAPAAASILTTLHFPARPAWAERVRMLDRSALSTQDLARVLLREASRYDVVVLDGAIGRHGLFLDRLVAAALARRHQPPRVVLTDCTWGPGSSPAVRTARRAALRAMDSPSTSYCVLSTAEARSFPRTWDVDPARVFCTPFYWTLPEVPRQLGPAGRGIFAGGTSLRDYRTLVQAVRPLDVPVTIASHWRPARAAPPLPPHVRLAAVTPEDFLQLLHDAAVVVVPLQPGLVRSAGQQTYLNAMALGKLVVVSDGPGVRDHIDDGSTGIVVPAGDPPALRAALRWATDPANRSAVDDIRARARAVALERWSPEAYVDHLLDVVDGVAAPSSAPSSARAAPHQRPHLKSPQPLPRAGMGPTGPV